MKYFVYIIFISLFSLNGHFSLCQKNIIIYNENMEPIPYVNVSMKNKGIGIHSNKNGEIAVDSRSYKGKFVFSKAGYQDTAIIIDANLNKIVLKNALIHSDDFGQIDGKRVFKLGEVHGEKYGVHTNSGKPEIYLKYFNSKEGVGYVIDNLKFKTTSDKKNAKVLIRLYAANNKLKPGNYLYEKAIEVDVKIGERINKIDLSELNLRMPKYGLYVGLETLIIPENVYSYTERNLLTDEISQRNEYMPNYVLHKYRGDANDNSSSYIFIGGEFYNMNNKELRLAMELKLKRP